MFGMFLTIPYQETPNFPTELQHILRIFSCQVSMEPANGM